MKGDHAFLFRAGRERITREGEEKEKGKVKSKIPLQYFYFQEKWSLDY